jgi:GTPase
MTNPAPTRRIVAIVGRPNVGKSALFNRLAGARVAIVHAERGVTRDRLLREVAWEEERFTLIDTGGICSVDRAREPNEIEAAVRQQAEAAMDDASAVIFVVDVESGITPLDEEVAGMLRKRGRAVFVAANKADTQARDPAAAEFERFGFPVFPVSALHDRGFPSLMGAVVRLLPAEDNPTVENPLRVTVTGRPNVGKSSYINALLRSDRVIVSPVPGTTRDSIDVPFVLHEGEQARHYVLTDTAGIRQIRKIDNSVERFSVMRAEKSIRRANVVVLMLDATMPATAQDRKIASLIEEHERGCVVLINKWDLQKEQTPREFMKDLGWNLPFMKHCPAIPISTRTGFNIKRSIQAIDLVASQVRATLPTGVLNRTFLDACQRVGPPAVRGRQLRIFYATQVGVEPIRIRLFVNSASAVHPQYADYLVRSLREKFGLDGAPVRLSFAPRPRSGGKSESFSES